VRRGKYVVYCCSCRAVGPEGDGKEEADRLWDQRGARPEVVVESAKVVRLVVTGERGPMSTKRQRTRRRLAQEGALQGIEVDPASRSPDVYLVVRVWPKLALWVRHLVHPAFQPTVEKVVLRAVQDVLIERFGIAGGELGDRISKMTNREALAELLDSSGRKSGRGESS
jgi:hypothetical protein